MRKQPNKIKMMYLNLVYFLKWIVSSTKNFPKNVKRVCIWLPIIWNDRDWDYFCFLRILQFKIQTMQKYFQRSDISYENKKSAAELQYVDFLLTRLLNNELYCEKEFQELEDKYGKLVWEFTPIEGTEFSRTEFYREKCTTEAMKEDERILTRDLHRKEDRMKELDNKRLWNFLEKNTEKWWD